MQLEIKQQQLAREQETLGGLREGLKNAQARQAHYTRLLAQGLSAFEKSQIAGMVVGQVFTQVSNVFSIASSFGYLIPNVGSPFAMTYGGKQVGSAIQGMSQAFRALSELASFQTSLAATLGGWERRAEDWELQQTLAT